MSAAIVTHICDICGNREERSLKDCQFPTLPPDSWIKIEPRRYDDKNLAVCSWQCVRRCAIDRIAQESPDA